MRIKSLTLDHFRGVAKLTVHMGGMDTSIYGANGAGKTTVANAVTWLLCDTPFTGEIGFSPKTTGVHKGTHAASMEVIADSGDTVTLAKEFCEKWTKKRGAATETLTGHETIYRVDDVPVSATEYSQRVAGLTGRNCEQVKMSLIHGWFAETMKPEARRKVLFDLIKGGNGLSDAEIIGDHRGLAELPRLLGKKSVEDWRKVAAESRRKLNKELDTLPALIKEHEQSLKGARMPEDIEREIAIAEASMAQGDPNAGIRAKLNKARAGYQAKLDDFNARLGAAASAAQTERGQAQIDLDDASYQLERLNHQIADDTAKREQLRVEFMQVAALEYQGDGLCPTCGRPLPPEQDEASRHRFEEQRQRRLDDINNRGKATSQSINEAGQRTNALKATIEQAAAQVAALDAKLNDLQAQRDKAVPFEETDECKRLTAQLTEAAPDAAARDTLKALRDELAAANAERSASRRIDELRAEQSAKSAQLDDIERGLAMCDEFSSLKASLITGAVNALFKTVRWQLFRPLISGGMEQVCSPMTQSADGTWIEWRASNTAAQINAGLEIAHVLNEHFGSELPVIIDRAESVTHPIDVPEQTIRLVVSAMDDELRVVTK